MRPGSITDTTQRLAVLQALLTHRYAGGLLYQQWSDIRTPDNNTRETKVERAEQRSAAVAQIWRLSQFLPDRAPNDPQPMPGRA